jgi:hypothetical protein
MMWGIKLAETNARGGMDVKMMWGIKPAETNARGGMDVKMMWGIKPAETNARSGTDVKNSDAFLTVLRSQRLPQSNALRSTAVDVFFSQD